MDIVKQLRESCFCEGRGCELCHAAAEITRLRSEEEDLRYGYITMQAEIGSLIPAIDGERANDPIINRVKRLRAELEEYRRGEERYRTALEQIVAPFEDLNFVSGNKLLTYIHDTATAALAADGEETDGDSSR